jgi:hypothetical protein
MLWFVAARQRSWQSRRTSPALMTHLTPIVEDMKGPNEFPIPLLGERSVPDQRTHVTQGLALLGEMAAGTAHEFRNILLINVSCLSFAENHSSESEKVSSSIAAAHDRLVPD